MKRVPEPSIGMPPQQPLL